METKNFRIHTKDFNNAMYFMYAVGRIINDYSEGNKDGFEIKVRINPEAEFADFELSPIRGSDTA